MFTGYSLCNGGVPTADAADLPIEIHNCQVDPIEIVTTAVAIGEHNLELATIATGPKFKRGSLYRIVATEIEKGAVRHND